MPQAPGPRAPPRIVARVLVGVEHPERELEIVWPLGGGAAEERGAVRRRLRAREQVREEVRVDAPQPEGIVQLPELGGRLHADEDPAVHDLRGRRGSLTSSSPGARRALRTLPTRSTIAASSA